MINESQLFLLLHFIVVNKIKEMINVVRLIYANNLLMLHQVYFFPLDLLRYKKY
jgi:hypothetical protein